MDKSLIDQIMDLLESNGGKTEYARTIKQELGTIKRHIGAEVRVSVNSSDLISPDLADECTLVAVTHDALVLSCGPATITIPTSALIAQTHYSHNTLYIYTEY